MNKISLFYCYTADILKTRLYSPPPAFIHIYTKASLSTCTSTYM